MNIQVFMLKVLRECLGAGGMGGVAKGLEGMLRPGGRARGQRQGAGGSLIYKILRIMICFRALSIVFQ